MELGEIATRKSSSASHIQSSADQTSPKFIDRFIRLKTRYWNRGFAIVILTFIGLTIQQYQWHSLIWNFPGDQDHDIKVNYFICAMCIGFIIGGVLAIVYPAHNVFGVSFIISSICHFVEDMDYSNAYLHRFSIFCFGMTSATAYSASYRICSFWIPLDKQSLRHVPIILWKMINLFYNVSIYNYYNKRVLLGVIGLAWFVLWLYVINGDRSQSLKRGFILFRIFRGSDSPSRSSGISAISSRRSVIMDIPWKSICTSMPVVALVVSCTCNTIADNFKQFFNHYHTKTNEPLRARIFIVLLLIFALIELVPEITACFSVTKGRKIFYCTFMLSMVLTFFSEVLPDGTFLFLDINDLFVFIFNVMPYFSLFSLEINHLDIAPKYASLLIGLQLFIDTISWWSFIPVLNHYWRDELLDNIQIRVLVAVICLAVAMFYAIFGSAEIQSWAEDKPVKENRRNMHEEVILLAV